MTKGLGHEHLSKTSRHEDRHDQHSNKQTRKHGGKRRPSTDLCLLHCWCRPSRLSQGPSWCRAQPAASAADRTSPRPPGTPQTTQPVRVGCSTPGPPQQQQPGGARPAGCHAQRAVSPGCLHACTKQMPVVPTTALGCKGQCLPAPRLSANTKHFGLSAGPSLDSTSCCQRCPDPGYYPGKWQPPTTPHAVTTAFTGCVMAPHTMRLSVQAAGVAPDSSPCCWQTACWWRHSVQP